MTQPEKIGPFRILETVGRGGMGAVYKAVHEEANEIVALKVLLDSVAEDSELRSRFEAEIETLKRLRHPNIVRLYGFGQEEGLLYYAMEYVDGPSLASLLKDSCFFSWEQVVHIGVEVCKALRHAHDRGIIHRDIKPANILLLENGDVKVSDYGIAHFFGNSRLTTANMVIGTIEFMSPEQAQAGPLTPKSDIYSLGALLYALLTGLPPYVARTLPEILQKYRSGPPDSIRYRRPEVPAVLDMFIMELLRVQPDKRPLDARIVGRRLEAIRVAFSQTPEENPFKDGIQRTQSPHDEDRLADIERQLDNGSYSDIVIGTKKKKGDRSASSNSAAKDEHFFEPFSTSSPGGFSFGNSHEFSTGGMTMVEGRNTSDSRYDFPEEADQTAGVVADSSSGKAAMSETGFDLSDSVVGDSGEFSISAPIIADTGIAD
ncbi:MAG: serine/threonine-protein kinase, partial [Planctomycetia bacterium]|nr:serine/threonine-protein kinase [Planctomycetia bacterium]